jgi:hypothetical protein
MTSDRGHGDHGSRDAEGGRDGSWMAWATACVSCGTRTDRDESRDGHDLLFCSECHDRGRFSVERAELGGEA